MNFCYKSLHNYLPIHIGILFCSVLGMFSLACSPEKKTKSPPNILILLADDMGYGDLGCYGGIANTPNIDALAASGIRFRHCYSTPICTTSRVKLMTGQYNFRNYTHFGYLDPKQKTFGQLMQSAGFTFVVHKCDFASTLVNFTLHKRQLLRCKMIHLFFWSCLHFVDATTSHVKKCCSHGATIVFLSFVCSLQLCHTCTSKAL